MTEPSRSIFVLSDLDREERGELVTIAPTLAVHCASGALDEFARATFADAEICFGNVPASWLPSARRLRWMQLTTTGIESYTDASWPSNVRVSNMRGLNDVPVAETIIGGLLAIHRQVVPLVQLQASRTWARAELRAKATCLTGSTVVVAGAGALARRLRDQLAGFACTVRLFGRTTEHADIVGLESLDEAISHADVLVNCLPETAETVGLLDRARLARLPSDAIVVNAGRGPVIDEEALFEMLTAGRLRGCVLDVTVDEPLDPASRWWSEPRCLLTQHTAGGWYAESRAKSRLFFDNLRLYLTGATLHNELDLRRGY